MVKGRSATPRQFVCVLCRSNEFQHLVERGDRLTSATKIFHYVQCNRCGLISLWPKLKKEEVRQYYPEVYDSYMTDETSLDKLSQLLYRRGLEKKRHTITRRKAGPGRLLDVGCATGQFLFHMARYGWQVSGVEPSNQAAAYARDRYHLNVINGELQDAKFPDRFFDVVTLWDVFEHLDDPLTSLIEINRIMVEEGLLVLSIPNLRSFDARIFKNHWIGWDAPRHLHLFTLETLETFLSEAGFRLSSAHCLGGEYGAFVLSLQTWMRGQTNLKHTSKLTSWIVLPFLRILLLPYFWVARWLGRGPIITAFCVKARHLAP